MRIHQFKTKQQRKDERTGFICLWIISLSAWAGIFYLLDGLLK